jgi:small subunit ribosomal protein S14
MKNLLTRNFKKRNLFKKQEKKKILCKSILYNLKLKPEIRWQFNLFSNKLNQKGSRTFVKDRCIITGRSKSNYKDLKISRIKFRELASKGFLPGIRKASW